MMKKLLSKSFLMAAMLVGGVNAWADPIETVGTDGAGDSWENRKYSTFYNIAQGETFHWNFTLTTYDGGGDKQNWYNWLLNVKATTGTATDDWFITLRADNYGWGDCYSNTDNMSNYNWSSFQADQNGATVDMYVNYSEDDQKVRTYVHTTTSDGTKTYFYYNTSSAITETPASVYIALCEQYAKLVINTAEKVTASRPNPNYLYSRTTGAAATYTNAWDASDISASSWVATNVTPTVSTDANGGLCCSGAPSGGYNVKKTFDVAKNAIVKYEGVWNVNRVTGRDNNYSYIQFGDKIRISIPNGGQFYLNTNGTSTTDNAITDVKNTTKSLEARAFSITINTTSNTVESFIFSGKNLTASVSGSFSGDFNSFTIGYVRGGSGSGSQNLTSLTVTQTEQVVTNVDYTVKFQDALGNTLKDDVVHDNGVVGEVYQATAAEMEAFYNNVDESLATKKYVYNSGQNISVEASSNAAENIITLVFDVYDKTAYTVKAQVSGSDLTTLASGSSYFDVNPKEYWSKYIKVGDQWYVADENTYGAEILSATTNIAFTATDAIDYFFEVENMTLSRIYNSYNGTAASNGSAKTLYGDANAKTTTTVAAGVYTVSLNGIKWANGYVDNYQIAYSTDNTNWVPVGTISYADGEEGVKTLAGAIIPTAAYIRIWTTQGSQTPRRYLDYMTLQKTADLPSTVSKTITAAGWATYCSPYILDFSSDIDNLSDVYIVTGATGSTLNLTSVKGGKVPANTGLLIEGTAGTVSIPVATSSSTDVSANKLVGVTSNTVIAAEAGYVLMGSPTVGFYKNNNAFTVGANTAYLPADFAEARAFYLFGDDEVTGVNEVIEVKEVNDDSFYDLQGRCVAQPQKGLYIVNGKKVVIK